MERGTRVSVSVPASLRARMFEYRGPVNWSALAAAAFREFLEGRLGDFPEENGSRSSGTGGWPPGARDCRA